MDSVNQQKRYVEKITNYKKLLDSHKQSIISLNNAIIKTKNLLSVCEDQLVELEESSEFKKQNKIYKKYVRYCIKYIHIHGEKYKTEFNKACYNIYLLKNIKKRVNFNIEYENDESPCKKNKISNNKNINPELSEDDSEFTNKRWCLDKYNDEDIIYMAHLIHLFRRFHAYTYNLPNNIPYTEKYKGQVVHLMRKPEYKNMFLQIKIRENMSKYSYKYGGNWVQNILYEVSTKLFEYDSHCHLFILHYNVSMKKKRYLIQEIFRCEYRKYQKYICLIVLCLLVYVNKVFYFY